MATTAALTLKSTNYRTVVVTAQSTPDTGATLVSADIDWGYMINGTQVVTRFGTGGTPVSYLLNGWDLTRQYRAPNDTATSYTITLSVTDSNNDVTETTLDITITANTAPEFTIDTIDIENKAATITLLSATPYTADPAPDQDEVDSDTLVSWRASIGGGSGWVTGTIPADFPETQPAITLQCPSSGTYTVTVQVFDSVGKSTSYTEEITITGTAPIAVASVAQANGSPTTVLIDASLSYSPSGHSLILQYALEEPPVTWISVADNALTTSFTYPSAGTNKPLRIRVTDDTDGGESSTVVSVTLNTSAVGPVLGLVLTNDGLSTRAITATIEGAGVTASTLTYGDGTQVSPVVSGTRYRHTYTQPGTYTVTLTATNATATTITTLIHTVNDTSVFLSDVEVPEVAAPIFGPGYQTIHRFRTGGVRESAKWNSFLLGQELDADQHASRTRQYEACLLRSTDGVCLDTLSLIQPLAAKISVRKLRNRGV